MRHSPSTKYRNSWVPFTSVTPRISDISILPFENGRGAGSAGMPTVLQPNFCSGGRHRAAGMAAGLRTPVVDAERARAVGDDLQQAAGHHQVLDEVEDLVWIGEVQVEEDRRRQA